MAQTRAATNHHLTKRWCWEVARRDDTRVARRLYRKQVIRCTGWMDDGFHVPLAVGVMALLEHACDTAIPSALLPFIQSIMPYRLKTLLEIERMHALPSWLCRDGAPMP